MKTCRSFLMLLLVVSAVLVLSSAAVAFDVSGTVNYEGSQTGRIYVTLSNNGFGGGNVYGVSIVSSGTFTIRGLQNGDYTMNAFMDSVGSRGRHPGNPQGSAPVTVSGGNVSGVAVTLTDPVSVTAAPPDDLNAVPGDSAAFVMWDAERDQNGAYKADTFNLYWSTNASFLSSWPSITAEGSRTGIPASDNNNVFIHTGLSNGQTYYYLMTGSTGTLVSSQTVTTAVTPAVPAGGNAVSGTVTASGFDPAGSNLHVVLFSDSNGVFFTTINNPAATQSFSVPGVSDGTFFVYPVYDLNTNGLMEQSDVRPNDDRDITMVEVTGGPVSGVASTVALVNSVTYATTSHWKQSNGCQEGYGLNTSSRDGGKLIANLAITSSPTNSIGFAGALDVGLNSWGEFTFGVSSGRPNIGDNFDFHIEYTDGSSTIVNKAVTAVIDDFATPVAPLGVIANTPTPTFTWSLGSTPSYEYVYQLSVNSQNSSWYPEEDILSSQLSAAYNFDGRAYPSSLPGNAAYSWSIGLRDNDGNESRTQVDFAMGGGIAGTVTNGSTGIGCVQVNATTSGQNNYLSSVWTNQDGTYAVGGFGAGTYKIQFNGAQTGYISEYYNNKTDWSIADTVTVLADQTTGSINAVLGQAGGISGQVTDGTNGISNVWVEAHDASTGWFVQGGLTDAGGNYMIGGLSTGTYKVWFGNAGAGYVSEWYNNAQDQASAAGVGVTMGSTTTGIDAVLAQGGSISGRVTDGASGIQNVNVQACLNNNPSPGMCSPYYNANTNSNGDYSISGLPTGSYKVQFNGGGAGYTSEWFDDTQDMNLATPIGVTAGATTTGIDAVLAQAGSISGGVTNGVTGVQGVFVYVCKYVGPTPNDCTYGFGGTNTDAGGNYTLTGLPAGQYEVQFQGSMSGYASEWYNDSPDQNGSQLVSVTTGNTTSGINAVLAQAGSIAGRVTSNGTTGINAVCVNVADAATGVTFWFTSTDPAGYYTMNGLTAGQYKVSFGCAVGYVDEWYNNKPDLATADAVSVTGGMMTTGIDAVLSPVPTGTSVKIGVFSDGYWYLDANQTWDWNGAPPDVFGIFGVGLTGAIPVVGDWNGDGKTEIGVYIDGVWYLDMNGNWQWDGPGIDVVGVFGVGLPNAVPVVGDWNGDGVSEIGIYSNGTWYLDVNRNWAWDGTPTDTVGTFGVGLPNAVPVTGDWNGDGKTKIGVYSDGYWYLDTNQSWAWEGEPSDTFGIFGIGLPNAVPVTGDWNGNGITKIGIYSDGNWYLDANASWQWDWTPTDTFGVFGTGLPNVVPVTGKW